MRPLIVGWGRLMRACVRWLCAGIHPPAPLPPVAGERPQSHVFVTRGDSTFLALAFLDALFRQGICDIFFLGGIRLWWYRPWRPVWAALLRALGRQPGIDADADAPHEVLAQIRRQFGRRAHDFAVHVAARRQVALVLPVSRGRGGPLADWADYTQVLLMLQPALDHDVVLWPHVLATREQSGRRGGPIDWLLGDSRQPGWLRHWTMLLVLRHGTLLRNEPVALPAWRARQDVPAPVPAAARLLRRELHAQMDEAQRVVAGPPLTNYEQMARDVLADPGLRAAIADEAATGGQSEPLLEVQARRKLRRMAAHYDVRAIRSMEHVLYWLFHRIYDGMCVDEPGLARVIEASRKAPVVFCPSHKSHIDYLVLSFVMWTHGIAPPHVAAGANLDFFPIGALFRRCGAFFLRRTFRDDPSYAALMRAYLAYLVRAGTSIEFFLEGTRSRSGKLLPPKFGLLRMLLDAFCQKARDDIMFVPVSIDYERILEAQSYRRELGGGHKRAETLRGLFGSMGLLRSRYGRLHVQFGEPVSLAAWLGERPMAEDVQLREETQKLGFHLLHQVARACSVTPTNVLAVVLLGHDGRGLAQGTLVTRAIATLRFLAAVGARLVDSLKLEEAQVGVLLETCEKLCAEDLLTYERAGIGDQERIFFVPNDARITLDYHKNAIMNHFGPAAVVCRALRAAGRQQPATYADTFGHAQFLSQLFKQEFIYPAGGNFQGVFDDTLTTLEALSLVQADAANVLVVQEADAVAHFASLLTSSVEGYRVAIEAALDLRAMELSPKDFVARALERARRGFLEGNVSRPEAASRTLMETALSWLLEQGLLVQRSHESPAVLRFGAAGHMRLGQIMRTLSAF